MSKIAFTPDNSGTGTFTIASPNSNSDRTLTLPDATGTVVLADATQTLTNKTISGPTISGATISGSTIQGGAITRGTAVASTSGTAIDFTGIPSWAKRVTVMLSGVSLSSFESVVFQLGTSGGFVTSGYLGASTRILGTAAASVNFGTGFRELLNGGNTVTRNGSIVFSSLGSNIWVANGVFGDTANAQATSLGGVITLSGTLDRVRITNTGTDTFDAGTINVSWEG